MSIVGTRYVVIFIVNKANIPLQFEIDLQRLDVCEVQGPSLPKNDPVHPLVGQRVQVTRNNFKGYYALVKDVGSSGVILELKARIGSNSSSPQQTVEWRDITVVYVPVSWFYKYF
jgi:hypothetical protein